MKQTNKPKRYVNNEEHSILILFCRRKISINEILLKPASKPDQNDQQDIRDIATSKQGITAINHG